MGIREWWYGTTPQTVEQPADEHRASSMVIEARNNRLAGLGEGDALGLVAVYRAVQIISTSVMQLSFDAYRDDTAITPKPILLRRPDVDEGLPAFLEKTTLSIALNGNAFWRVFRDNQGRVSTLRVMNPRDVEIQADQDGTVTGYQVPWREKAFTKAEVHHLSHMRVPGETRGRGPIQAARQELYGAQQTRDYASFWFDEAGVPTGILTSEQLISKDNADAIKARWNETQGGQRGTAILGQGFTYSPVYLSPEDAQWIAARQFDTTAISRLFGIPASLMLAAVEGSSMTYQNVTQAWTEYQRFTLARYVQEIEQAFTALLPRGTDTRANYGALLAPDIATRYELYAQAIPGGWLSVNEAREQEGRGPAPDGGFKTAARKLAEQQAFTPDQDQQEDDDDE